MVEVKSESVQVTTGDSKIQCSMSCLSRSDGSATFSVNSTTQLMCSVFGPGEVKIMKELSNCAYINITYKPRTGIPSNKEKVNEYSIRSICDGAILTYLHPRTAINIILQELETDSSAGNQLACAINCACMALLDAAIPLKYNFAAVHSAILNDDEELPEGVSDRVIHFPTPKQEKASSLLVTFVFDSIDNDVMYVTTSGMFDKKKFDLLLKSAQQYANENLFRFFAKKVEEKYRLSLAE